MSIRTAVTYEEETNLWNLLQISNYCVLWPKISKNGKYAGPDFNYQIPSIAAAKQRLRHRVPSSLLSTVR